MTLAPEQLGMCPHSDWLIPHWPAPARVRSLCTTRSGGSSLAPYDSLNLGDHVGDSPVDVAANRALLQRAIPAKAVFLSQVHGSQVVWLTEHTTHGTVADACVTDQTGLACTMMVADCLPILLSNTSGTLVGAVHAGWRGLAGQNGEGVLEASVRCFNPPNAVGNPNDGANLMAWLGPCIGPQAFEVGQEVYDAFAGQDAHMAHWFVPNGNGKWLANLPALARYKLVKMGVTKIFGNDGGPEWCTVGNPSRFFSHRRDGVSGRLAACIWLE